MEFCPFQQNFPMFFPLSQTISENANVLKLDNVRLDFDIKLDYPISKLLKTSMLIQSS